MKQRLQKWVMSFVQPAIDAAMQRAIGRAKQEVDGVWSQAQDHLKRDVGFAMQANERLRQRVEALGKEQRELQWHVDLLKSQSRYQWQMIEHLRGNATPPPTTAPISVFSSSFRSSTMPPTGAPQATAAEEAAAKDSASAAPQT